MTYGDVINIVNTVLNKDLNGRAFTAAEFQSLFNANSHMLFAEKLGLPNEYQLNAPIARRGVGVSRKISQELRPFLRRETKTITGGAFSFTNLNETLGYLVAINPATVTGRGFDELEPDELADRIGSAVVAPTTDDPAFVWTGANSIAIYPSTITSISITYYKQPDDAVIQTTTNSTTLLEEFDSVNSSTPEWYDEQLVEIAYRILRDAGTNIERQDVVALGERVSNE